MRIKVTAEHIANGKRCDTRACPVASALLAMGMPEVTVMKRAAYFWKGPPEDQRFVRVTLPENACDWIRDYDAGREVGPFEFELEVQL